MNMTIVYFHTGRGGRYYNPGYTTFCGCKNITEVLSMADNSNRHTFLNPENYYDIKQNLKRRDLSNLLELLDNCAGEDDYSKFENRTGLELGENWYFDCNGNPVISEEEVNSGVGCLNWDNEYDTDVCGYLKDCLEDELQTIIDSNHYESESVIREYFDECTDLKIDWELFNGNYTQLIAEYFTFYDKTNIDDFYDNII